MYLNDRGRKTQPRQSQCSPASPAQIPTGTRGGDRPGLRTWGPPAPHVPEVRGRLVACRPRFPFPTTTALCRPHDSSFLSLSSSPAPTEPASQPSEQAALRDLGEVTQRPSSYPPSPSLRSVFGPRARDAGPRPAICRDFFFPSVRLVVWLLYASSYLVP